MLPKFNGAIFPHTYFYLAWTTGGPLSDTISIRRRKKLSQNAFRKNKQQIWRENTHTHILYYKNIIEKCKMSRGRKQKRKDKKPCKINIEFRVRGKKKKKWSARTILFTDSFSTARAFFAFCQLMPFLLIFRWVRTTVQESTDPNRTYPKYIIKFTSVLNTHLYWNMLR